MRPSTTLAITALAAAAKATSTPSHLLLARDEQSYIDSVCSPNTTDTSSTIPPCIEINNIEIACTPNGTTPEDYLAHAECICNGSFFPDWLGCLNCQYVHGSRSEAVVDAYADIISEVSSSMCTGTPTADFADLFSSVSQSATLAVAGEATTTSDLYPSDAAVSLYYTISGSQGPGAITGAAASATASGSGSGSVSSSSPSSSAENSGSSSSPGRSSSSSSSTRSTGSSTSGSSSAAAASTSASQTGAAVGNVVGKGFMALAAGAVMVL